jgi:hypothetical protein
MYGKHNSLPPNTACTRTPKSIGAGVVGLCAFSSSFRGLKGIPAKRCFSSRPPAGNANRWAFENHSPKVKGFLKSIYGESGK